MAWPSRTASYYSWEEVVVASGSDGGEKGGRREVRYYLKRRDGGVDLAVVGKEKSLRHMTYYYALKNKDKRSSVPCKLKSRRDVIDWLNSIVSDALPQQSNVPVSGSLIPKAAGGFDDESRKDAEFRDRVQCTKSFSWMGSPWICRKKRKHYPSFCRNSVRVSVNNFVYVLAEENKRLIAYLDDMYEDSRGNNMVVVRWFHKIDEVGIVLPHSVNDREIFFSLCLQDINIECIDGLATVLSPQHFEKFQKEATNIPVDVFFCQKIFENDDVRHYDITQLKGYWKQELLRNMYDIPITKYDASAQQPDVYLRPKKRHRLLEDDLCFYSSFPEEVIGAPSANHQNPESKKDRGDSDAFMPKREARQSFPQYIKKGSLVEVLSQDSGIRGCWFRALIIKKHKDKVKVQYQDIHDAEAEANKLEEWILASRIASPDQLGLRVTGRIMIRPPSVSSEGKLYWVVDIGTVVDVWWHGGWWEGIVVKKESEEKFRVYFPGERQVSVVHRNDLRRSLEWLGNRWISIEPRPDLVRSILSSVETKEVKVKHTGYGSAQVAIGNSAQSGHEVGRNNPAFLQPVPNLLKDVLLSQLKWKTSRKRKRVYGSSVHKPDLKNGIGSTSAMVTAGVCERSLVSGSFKVDCENCKYIGDPMFGSSVVPPLSSLVMSR